MKFAIGIVLLVAALLAKLWTSGSMVGDLPAMALVGGVGVVLLALFWGVWMRNRRRKRQLRTRDSALW